MIDDLAGHTTGKRIQIVRERKGFSRDVVGALVGHTGSWLKGIESGRRNAPRLDKLIELAKVLQVQDVMVLVGTDMSIPGSVSLPMVSFNRIPHPAVPAIREAIHDPLLNLPDHSPELADLRSRVADAWHLWHTSPTQRTDVGRILPSLITDSRVVARRSANEQRRTAQDNLASVYALCEQLLAWASEPELLWLISDRGISAAQDADQPHSLALSAWVLGNVRRAVGDHDGALELVNDATQIIGPLLDRGADDLAGMWGALHLHAAITCARAGREGEAWRYWREGSRTAERLQKAYAHPLTQFGAANVAVHGVSVGADLSKSSTARSRAEAIDPDSIHSLERRSRLMIETARAYANEGDHPATLHWLKSAYEVSTENVHYSPLARNMAMNIVSEGGPLIRKDARSLATTLGLPV